MTAHLNWRFFLVAACGLPPATLEDLLAARQAMAEASGASDSAAPVRLTEAQFLSVPLWFDAAVPRASNGFNRAAALKHAFVDIFVGEDGLLAAEQVLLAVSLQPVGLDGLRMSLIVASSQSDPAVPLTLLDRVLRRGCPAIAEGSEQAVTDPTSRARLATAYADADWPVAGDGAPRLSQLVAHQGFLSLLRPYVDTAFRLTVRFGGWRDSGVLPVAACPVVGAQ